MKFSCGKCGRSYSVRDELAGRRFHMTCKGCGAAIFVGGAAERDPFAPADDDSLEPLPPEPSEAPDAEAASFDPFADGAARHAPRPPGEAEAAFADLARELEGSTGGTPMVHRTGELPLVPTARGELTPTPSSVPAAARKAPLAPAQTWPPKDARKESSPKESSPARPRPPARPRRSLAVPVVAVAIVVGCGVLGLVYARSSGSRGEKAPPRKRAAEAEQAPITPPSPPASAPAAPLRRHEPVAPVAAPSGDRVAETATPGPTSAPTGVGKRAAAPAQAPAREPSTRAAVAPPPPPRPARAQERPAVAVARPPPQAPAVASEGRASVTPPSPPAGGELPPLDDARVDAAFAGSMKSFDACVAAARANEPSIALGGRTVTLTVTVNPSGKVLYPTLDDAELSGTELGKCLKREAGKIPFPAFGGDPVRVHKPLTLK